VAREAVFRAFATVIKNDSNSKRVVSMTIRFCIYAAFVGLMSIAGGASAQQQIAGGMSPEGGDAKAGQTKSELCQGCHGVDGMSMDPTTFPNLAGQYAGYIYKQVLDFQLGNRNNDTMSAMAATVTNKKDLEDIAAYFSSRKPMKGKPGNASLAKKGEKLFKNGNKKLGNYAACIRCHGVNGKGKSKTNSLFPVIGGQQKAYLIKQLTDFKAGTRTNDPAGMMAMVAKGLDDKEIKAVAEYVSGL
jgi:cytochrome c553